MSFTLDVQRFVEKAKKNPETVARQVSFKLFSAIIKESPVDTGRFRMNWQTAGATPASGTIEGFDKSGNAAISDAASYIFSASNWHEFTLTNNLPYAAVIEFGGYPNPVKYGTWNPKTKEYEIRSAGGYSKQAPSGVVRKNVTEFNKLLEEEAAKVN